MDAILSVLVLAAVVMLGGALYLWRRGGSNKRALLMLLAGLVMLANVLIWTIPDKDGAAPLDRAAEAVR